MAHGERIGFEEVEPLDSCVVGSVAVTRSGGRTDKGAGFADLETGIFRELGKIGPKTPMATTIHSRQQAGIRERGTGTKRHRPIAFAEAEILPCWSTGNG